MYNCACASTPDIPVRTIRTHVILCRHFALVYLSIFSNLSELLARTIVNITSYMVSRTNKFMSTSFTEVFCYFDFICLLLDEVLYYYFGGESVGFSQYGILSYSFLRQILTRKFHAWCYF